MSKCFIFSFDAITRKRPSSFSRAQRAVSSWGAQSRRAETQYCVCFCAFSRDDACEELYAPGWTTPSTRDIQYIRVDDCCLPFVRISRTSWNSCLDGSRRAEQGAAKQDAGRRRQIAVARPWQCRRLLRCTANICLWPWWPSGWRSYEC